MYNRRLISHLILIILFSIFSYFIRAYSSEPIINNSHDITYLEKRLEDLIPSGSRLEKLAGGFNWIEGPLWNRKGSFLLFSEIPGNSVLRWKEYEGVSLYLEHSGYTGKKKFTGREPGSNGLTYDSSSRLVMCQHGNRQIARLEPDGSLKILADRYQGKKLNSPNDLVYNSNGDLYFTDPPFGLPELFDDPGKDLPYQGVFRLSRDGKLYLLESSIKAPNGIALSPDEKTLYITDVNPERPAWLAYDVKKDGTIGNGRIFYDAMPWKKPNYGGPDGLKVDIAGNIFAARPGGINIFAPDSTLLGFIDTGVPTSNLAWGNDGSTLYITAGSELLRIKLTTYGYK